MKKTSFTIAAVVILSSFAITAAAQNRVLSRADIPFAFAAHDQRFEAGAYQLRQIGANIVRFEEVATGKGVTLLSPQPIGESDTTIVFHRYGTRQFLAAVVAPSYQISLSKSKVEQELASSPTKTTIVALKAAH